MSETLVTNYDEVQELKGQIAELRQMLAELHEVNAELHKEIATLVKDGKRLDWLLNRAYTIQLREGDILTSREDIDREMEEL